MKHIHAGKVRDLYEDGDSLILVASDRVSVFDVVLPTPIPEKGAMLTQLSNWWFGFFDGIPNHILSTTDVPAEFAGRGVRVKPLKMLKVECVARGYLTGGGLAEYKRSGTVSGIALPPDCVTATSCRSRSSPRARRPMRAMTSPSHSPR